MPVPFVARYYILYKFGGIYLDLDFVALKPLDYWTYTHQALMSHENYEHSYLRLSFKQPFLINAVMGARPRHPYFKMLIDNLASFAHHHEESHQHVLYATGPFFVTDIYNRLQRKLNRSHDQAQKQTSAVSVVHPTYFLPMFDPIHPQYEVKCRGQQPTQSHRHKYEICEQLKARNYENTLSPDAFLNHMWTHTNLRKWSDSMDSRLLFDIYEAIPRSRYVSKVLMTGCGVA